MNTYVLQCAMIQVVGDNDEITYWRDIAELFSLNDAKIWRAQYEIQHSDRYYRIVRKCVD